MAALFRLDQHHTPVGNDRFSSTSLIGMKVNEDSDLTDHSGKILETSETPVNTRSGSEDGNLLISWVEKAEIEGVPTQEMFKELERIVRCFA